MQWTIKLEFTPDGGETVVHEIGSITRPIADLEPEEIGWTLAEGHELVRDIERRMISDQIHIYTLCFRRCAHCGQRQGCSHEVRSDHVWGLSLSGAYDPGVSMPGRPRVHGLLFPTRTPHTPAHNP
jgi:hypothetical protein